MDHVKLNLCDVRQASWVGDQIRDSNFPHVEGLMQIFILSASYKFFLRPELVKLTSALTLF